MALQNKTGLYLFLGSRWVLLLIGMLVYTQASGVSPGLLLIAVLFQTIYSLVHLDKMRRKVAFLAVAADVCFGFGMLWLTGGLSSPFLFYSFTGLGMIKRFVAWKPYYVISLGYVIMLPTVFALTSSSSIYSYVLAHFTYGFVIFAFFCVVGLVHYTLQNLRKQYRKFVMIYSSRHMGVYPFKQRTIYQVEELLKKVLDDREVILCLESAGPYEKIQSWKHTYFTNYMKQNTPSSPRLFTNLPFPTGEVVPLYIQTLVDRNGKVYGWLLVKAEKQELSILHKMYMQFILVKLEAFHFTNEELQDAEETAVAIERNTIAQNIHDGITQELFFISIQLFQLKNALPSEARETVLPYVTEIEKKVKESHRDIRQFIIELKDEKRKFNLHHAIEKLLYRVTEHTEVKPKFENIGWVAHEQLDIEEAIYHLVEEAANNVIKHARAKHIHVKIEVTSVQWTIMVKDDGIGMQSSSMAQEGRFGLGGMEKRIKALNGALSFHSELAVGTTVTAYIPRERSIAYV
ncbi:sensor histidine kinase [Paenibacillus alba]|uniref:histidine kinase n=1 Tax=Paenibacillus alba TaxID=1197127 RepID=A0ABU6GC61_9BACL|nr:ATP-binding protein [Paenibacillus alba]MEC0231235.1 ATP-binding protein [Paenibacillus alba]NQX69690.1 hypothetical protein [Paenibacillus alba]